MTTIGSLFSGIGAMSLAAETHYGGRVIFDVERDPYCRRVLARHRPGVPCFDDVTTCGAHNLPRPDVLIGGPPCVDLSTAGKQAGLHAERSGLFFDLVRIAGELRPDLVIVENVPALLSVWRGTVERAFAAIGYGVTWARVAAAHAGAPHLRRRVFVLATRGGAHRGVCDAGAVPRVVAHWPSPTADLSRSGSGARPSEMRRRSPNLEAHTLSADLWPSPTASYMDPADMGKWWARRAQNRDKHGNNGQRLVLGVAARWPTATTGDAYGSGSRCLDSRAHADVSLTDAMRPDRAKYEDRAAAVAAAAAERWATPIAGDEKNRSDYTQNAIKRRIAIGKQVSLDMSVTGRLNPDWVEALQGLDRGYTRPDGDLIPWAGWPAPMVRGMYGDSPQYGHEAPRTTTTTEHRSQRLRAIGNANPPQQYRAAFALLDAGPRQASIFDLMGAR